MSRPASILALAALAGCLSPTEIVVSLSSQDLVCTGSGSSQLVFRSADIVAAATEAAFLTQSASASTSACKAGNGGVSFGSIVLVPQTDAPEAELVVAAGIAIDNGPSATGA